MLDAAGVVDGDPTAPVELTPDLDLPAWQFLRDHAPEWLLPGAGTLLDDTVVALTTNPAFVDAFLLGLNAQVVAELRFRNYPLIPGWTPVRTFWDRANAATGAVDDDIVDIATWPADSPFGAASHQTPSASSADLVVLFNTPLFREYPGTLVYLVPALRNAGRHARLGGPARLRRPPVPRVPGADLARPDVLRLRPRPRARRRAVGRAGGDRERAPLLQRRRRSRARRATAPTSPPDTVSAPRRVLIRGDILLGGCVTVTEIGVLLPVRLETRFVAPGSPARWRLRVRVVPDAVSITNHDDLAVDRRARRGRGDVACRRRTPPRVGRRGAARGATLAAAVGAERAAWLARTFPPVTGPDGPITITGRPRRAREMRAPRVMGLPPTMEIWIARGGPTAGARRRR